MDPTTNLSEQLHLARRILHEGVGGKDDAEMLAELVLKLNAHIVDGGVPPQQWWRTFEEKLPV